VVGALASGAASSAIAIRIGSARTRGIVADRLATNLGAMAETLPKEGISARLAEIRGQLKLLADYL
jgi:hypothetical protein